MTKHELGIRFTYHKPKEGQAERYAIIRDNALDFAIMLDDLCPESREKDTAMIKLEECVMHANASIARREIIDAAE